MDLLEAAIDTIIAVNHSDLTSTLPIEEFLFQIEGSYPHITRFSLLFRKWDDKSDLNEKAEDSQQRKIIKTIRVYAKKWCEQVAKEIPLCDDQFAVNLLYTLARLDPDLYEGFAKQHLGQPEKIVWMLERHIDFNESGQPIRWIKSDSLFLPPAVRDHFKGKLSRLSQDEMDDLSPESAAIIQLFLQTFSHS
jgi:hypothetical protein